MKSRKENALEVRIAAAQKAAQRPHPRHIANGDETKFRRRVNDNSCPGGNNIPPELLPECSQNQNGPTGNSVPSYLASFTKGMPHNRKSGLVKNPNAYYRFVLAIDSGDPRDFKDIPLGPTGYKPNNRPWKSEKAQKACGAKGAKVRAWESQGGGLTFDLEGPDAQAVTMPPAPIIGSDELISEIAEVYAQAMLRDVPFTKINDLSGTVYIKSPDDIHVLGTPDLTNPLVDVEGLMKLLNNLPWFKDSDCCKLSPEEITRKRGPFKGGTLFRGVTPGDKIGPYISQFLLAGNGGVNGNDPERCPEDGLISYGALSIDQRVRLATPCRDYMQTWYEWLDVQDGADLRGQESYIYKPSEMKRRFITTPRDLATYVHYDALYEAYLNACLILLANGTPFDPGIPFQADDFRDRQQGFAHFGGPHILSLVTEVATRALKAVRFQKFNIHRRLRPEALAARLAKSDHPAVGVDEIKRMVEEPNLKQILKFIEEFNPKDANLNANYLLPMAFCEGSPMHPSYGAGHATVAGACITILKAFFDHKQPVALTGNPGKAFVADEATNGVSLKVIDVVDENGVAKNLTVEGELNKLASNISIGRNWAGVHYFTDYIESLRMGEQIAIGILEEQKMTYGENFSMTIPLFDGGSIRI